MSFTLALGLILYYFAVLAARPIATVYIFVFCVFHTEQMTIRKICRNAKIPQIEYQLQEAYAT